MKCGKNLKNPAVKGKKVEGRGGGGLFCSLMLVLDLYLPKTPLNTDSHVFSPGFSLTPLHRGPTAETSACSHKSGL